MRKRSLIRLSALLLAMGTTTTHASLVYDVEGAFTNTQRLNSPPSVPLPANGGDTFSGTVEYTPSQASFVNNDSVIDNALSFSFQFNSETASGDPWLMDSIGGDMRAFEEQTYSSYAGSFQGGYYYLENIEWSLGPLNGPVFLPSANEMKRRLAESDFALLWNHSTSPNFELSGSIDSTSLRSRAVPAPGAFALLAGALVLFGLLRRRRSFRPA